MKWAVIAHVPPAAAPYDWAMDIGQRHVADRIVGEQAADLTEHRVVHRGMRLDLALLASTAAWMSADGLTCPDRGRICPPGVRREAKCRSAHRIASLPAQLCPVARRVAFRDYLGALVAVVDSHLRVDADAVAALRPAPAVAPTSGVDDRRNVAQLLDLAIAIADRHADEQTGGDSTDGSVLATALRQAGLIVLANTTEQERQVFPLIRNQLRAADYAWVQAEFRSDLPPGVLAFLAPWTIRHATGNELPALLDSALGVPARIFQHRFEALRAQVYGVKEVKGVKDVKEVKDQPPPRPRRPAG